MLKCKEFSQITKKKKKFHLPQEVLGHADYFSLMRLGFEISPEMYASTSIQR